MSLTETTRLDREALTERQRAVMDVIARYYDAVGEACPATVVARRVKITPQGVRGHIEALHRKGWLLTDTPPATPSRDFLHPR